MSAVSFAKNVFAKDAKMFRFNLFLTITAPILLVMAVFTTRLALNQSTDQQRADDAEAARWTGLAHLYAFADAATDQQRADAAEAARWNGLAQLYAHADTSSDQQRADAAEAARWTGLAQLYAHADASSDQQRAEGAEAARWTGLALQEFERTGDRNSLPQCIPANVMVLLPGSGNSPWRSLVPTCSQ